MLGKGQKTKGSKDPSDDKINSLYSISLVFFQRRSDLLSKCRERRHPT